MCTRRYIRHKARVEDVSSNGALVHRWSLACAHPAGAGNALGAGGKEPVNLKAGS